MEFIINKIVNHRIDITASYSDWFAIGSAFACEFGENGRRYFHEVSQFYLGYKPMEADKQYTACLKHSHGFDIGIFYHHCADYGLMFKDLIKS